MDRKIVKILGYGVDSFTLEEAVDYISKNKGQIVTINPEMIEKAQKNSDFADIINNAELVVADGVGIQIGLKTLGYNVTRIPGIDLGKALLKKFANKNKKVALIGAKEEILIKACENLCREIPELNIVYSHNGYFEDENDIVKQLENSQPELILVALGSPKQEFFINNLKNKLPQSVMIGLGGSFDVWSGYVLRAPIIWQKLGLEWFYRTVKEPQRFKRIFPTLPLFMLKVLKERLKTNVE